MFLDFVVKVGEIVWLIAGDEGDVDLGLLDLAGRGISTGDGNFLGGDGGRGRSVNSGKEERGGIGGTAPCRSI